MGNEHTPGPWFVGERFGGSVDSSGVPRTEIGANDSKGGKLKVADAYNHNAHRIVACVNALEGFDEPPQNLNALIADLYNSNLELWENLRDLLFHHPKANQVSAMEALNRAIFVRRRVEALK